MQARSLVYDRILSSRDIIDYLVARGHTPHSAQKGQTAFCCPLHHEDTPSFFVYPADGEKNFYQSFYCYGCKVGGGIVKLKVRLEHLSVKEAVNQLSDGLSVDTTDEIDYWMARFKEDQEQSTGDSLEDAVFMASRMIYRHLVATVFDHEQVAKCDAMLQRIDEYAERNDRQRVLDLVDVLPDVLWDKLKDFEEIADTDAVETASIYANMK